MELISMQGVTKIYRTKEIETVALEGVNLDVHEGEFLSVMGPSGCGKSTMLNIMGLLDVPTEGKVIISEQQTQQMNDGAMAEFRNRMLGFVFQSFHLVHSLNVLDNVELPLLYRKCSEKERRELATSVLERVGLSHRIKHYPSQLSGGQCQRVAIARALVGAPRILLADEPTTALDVTIQGQILALLGDLSRERGMGLLLITHDLGVVAEMADEVGVMYAGRIVERAPVRALFAEPRHPYTWGLIRSAPTLDTPPSAKLDAIPGTVPSPGDLPQGCPFRPRCPEAHERCFKTPPVIESAGPDGAREVCCWLAEAR